MIGEIVEEVVRVDGYAVMLITKVVETFKYFAYTSFGISNKTHRGKYKILLE